MAAREGSFLGKIFRRLADFFDGQRKPGRSLLAGSPREVDIVTLAIVFIGLVVAGTLIHTWYFLLWNVLFAAFFCVGTWLIFYSARWRPGARGFLLGLLLLASIPAATDRLLGLFTFSLLFLFLLRGLLISENFLRRETLSVIAVALLCFSSYGAFTAVLESVRSLFLHLRAPIPLQCEAKSEQRLCRAGEVAFSVPEYWRPGGNSRLVEDLRLVAPLKPYADSATDNTIAFAAFAAPSAQVMQQIQNFFISQKGFMRSKAMNSEPLTPQQILKSHDTSLYAVRYQGSSVPGYLAGSEEMTALVLLHERRGMTWLFVVDGTDLSAREFILHRIISGFR